MPRSRRAGRPVSPTAKVRSQRRRKFGGGAFYGGTHATLGAAWVRPRVPGWIAPQDELSELTREAIVNDRAAAIHKVNAAYAALLRAS